METEYQSEEQNLPDPPQESPTEPTPEPPESPETDDPAEDSPEPEVEETDVTDEPQAPRELADFPYEPRHKPLKQRDQHAEEEARQAELAAEREEHNVRTGG